MGEILEFILDLVKFGFGFYLVHNIFSKNTKEFHCTVDENGFELGSEFYEDN